MNLIHFGRSDDPLFGVYHAPRAPARPGRGVLFCYPIGHEYMKSHRAFRLMAGQLARAGVHVFRFDYYGTGDSSGGSREGNAERWLADVDLAAHELRSLSGLRELSFVGLRFGATLAALASARSGGVDRLVLWDPVVCGPTALGEMRQAADPSSPHSSPNRKVGGVVDLPLTESFAEGVSAIDIRSLVDRLPDRSYMVVSDENIETDSLRHTLSASSRLSGYGFVPDERRWSDLDDSAEALIPQPAMQWIIERVSA